MTIQKVQRKFKVFIVRNTNFSADWLEGSDFEITREFEESDIVLFTGNNDLDPCIYDTYQEKGSYTYSKSEEDVMEYLFAVRAKQEGKLIIGVEKGAHLVTVLAGGQIIQHMTHPSKHKIVTYDSCELTVPSSHHQLMKPFNLPSYKYYVVAHAEELSTIYLNGDDSKVIMKTDSITNKSIEPEIVYYPGIKALCFQYDPNVLSPDKLCVILAKGLVSLLTEDKLLGVLALNIPLADALKSDFKFTSEQLTIIKNLKINKTISDVTTVN